MNRVLPRCVESAGLCGRFPVLAVPLRVVPSPIGLPSKRGPGAEALILWTPDAKSRLIGKDADAGKE